MLETLPPAPPTANKNTNILPGTSGPLPELFDPFNNEVLSPSALVELSRSGSKPKKVVTWADNLEEVYTIPNNGKNKSLSSYRKKNLLKSSRLSSRDTIISKNIWDGNIDTIPAPMWDEHGRKILQRHEIYLKWKGDIDWIPDERKVRLPGDWNLSEGFFDSISAMESKWKNVVVLDPYVLFKDKTNMPIRIKKKILLLKKFVFYNESMPSTNQELKKELEFYPKISNNFTPPKVPVPKEALHLYSSKHLTDKYFANPNLIIMGPCPYENLARIQPTVLFPGCYADNTLLWGIVEPSTPSFKLDPKRSSTDQLNQTMIFYDQAYIFDYEKCIKFRPWLDKQYVDHLAYCNLVLQEIYKRNIIYADYNKGFYNGFFINTNEVRMYAALDRYWHQLQAEYGQILFENYKPFHRLSKYNDYRWEYYGTRHKYYENSFWKYSFYNFPYCQPSWRDGLPIRYIAYR